MAERENISQMEEISIQYVHDIQAMFHSFSKHWSHNKAK